MTGFTISPRLSSVNAPSNGVTPTGPKTIFEVPPLAEFEGRLADVRAAMGSVGQGKLFALQFPEREFAGQRSRNNAVQRAGIDQKFDLDRMSPGSAGIRDLRLGKCDSPRRGSVSENASILVRRPSKPIAPARAFI